MKKSLKIAMFILPMLILIGLVIWRYQQVNQPITQPAVITKTYRVPARITLGRRQVRLTAFKCSEQNGEWHLRLHFASTLTHQDLKQMTFMLSQKRKGRDVPSSLRPVISADKHTLQFTNPVYSAANQNRLAIITLPKSLNEPNKIQIIQAE